MIDKLTTAYLVAVILSLGTLLVSGYCHYRVALTVAIFVALSLPFLFIVIRSLLSRKVV